MSEFILRTFEKRCQQRYVNKDNCQRIAIIKHWNQTVYNKITNIDLARHLCCTGEGNSQLHLKNKGMDVHRERNMRKGHQRCCRVWRLCLFHL